MDALFDLLLLIGAMSVLYGVLGLLAGITERSDPLWQWLRRVLMDGGRISATPGFLNQPTEIAEETEDPAVKIC